MTRYLYLVFCISVFITAQSQSPRKVLVEHFTQASCGPCATVNPIIHPIMERNKTVLTRITHQVSWPGHDPMNKDNPGDVAARVSYYGVTSVPSTFLNAGTTGNSTTTITDAAIRAAAKNSSPYEITITNAIQPHYNALKVDVEIKLTGTFQGKPMLRVAVLESKITWNVPPGSNGEKEFHHVLKKFLPSPSGTNISDLNTTGDSKVFSFYYQFEKLYDPTKLEIAAFIQDDTNKEILQAEGAKVDFKLTPGDDAVIKHAIASRTISDSLICGTSVSPTVKILNMGNTNIQSLYFEYSANDGPQTSYLWTGNIASFQERDIQLPEVPVLLAKDHNKLVINALKVNDNNDANPINNSYSIAFKVSPMTSLKSYFEIKPLSKPDVISFVIRNSKGVAVVSDGPFPNNSLRSYELNLEPDECYAIEIDNNTASLNGTFKLMDENRKLLINGLITGTSRTFSRFGTYLLTGATSSEVNEIFLHPNFTSNISFLEWTMTNPKPINIQVLDLNGHTLRSYNTLSASGKNQFQLELYGLRPGLYYVRVINDNKFKIFPLVKIE